ncbi:hypothetical protein L211DRAFT_832879 [Terfezia boudieri ATCC MYA-4762]|uniref:Uncharacterized protein n=1 Tax=Terfezia boudieri ATCC MYA-4762 TaxID=1051890 RepID=A0A3N4M9G6_9PEZI|nr:hypothetical protein L211DRAFT_832879 [Terfezia boudieri ATCC MYA-4762]
MPISGLGPDTPTAVGIICGITLGIIIFLIIAWCLFNYWRHSVLYDGGRRRNSEKSSSGSYSVRN